MSNAVFRSELRRVGSDLVEATTEGGGRVLMGPKGTPGAFTPVELLLAAIAGCSGMDLCSLGARDHIDLKDFQLRLRGTKPLGASQLDSISVEYSLPGLESATADRLIAEVRELCTVALTVKDGCRVSHRLLQPPAATV